MTAEHCFMGNVCQAPSLAANATDVRLRPLQPSAMPKKASPDPEKRKGETLSRMVTPARLYLREWLEVRGKKQAAISAELGWDPTRVSKIVNGKQPYTGSDIALLADWLELEHHELLMLPQRAEDLRRIRQAAERIARELSVERE